MLAACGALRTGAGLVYVGVPREIYPIVAVKCQEAMAFPLPEEYDKLLEKARSCDVAVIGPAWAGIRRWSGWCAPCYVTWRYQWCWTPMA